MTPSATASGCASRTAARVAGGSSGRISAHATITSSRSTSPTGPDGSGCRLRLGGAGGAGSGAGSRRRFQLRCDRPPRVRAAAPRTSADRRGAERRGRRAARRPTPAAVRGCRRQPSARPVRAGRRVRPAPATAVPASRRARRNERDLEHEARVGGVGAAHVDDRLPERLEHAHQHAARPTCSPSAASARLVVVGASTRTRPSRRREQERVAYGREEVFGERGAARARRRAARRARRARRRRLRRRPRRRSASRPSNAVPPNSALDLLDVERAVRDGLVEQRQRVAHRAGRSTRDDRERLGIGVDPLLRADVGEVPGELVDRVERELVVLRARPDRGRDLERVGGGEHEHHVLGRLLERLEQRRLGAGARACAPRRGCRPSSPPPALRYATRSSRSRMSSTLALRRRVDLDHVERRALGDARRSSRTRRTGRRRRRGSCSSGPWRGVGRSWSCPCPGGPEKR